MSGCLLPPVAHPGSHGKAGTGSGKPHMLKRILVALAGGVVGWLIGSLAAYVTGWRWWIRIFVAIVPAIAVLLAERKRLVRTADELNRPVELFPNETSREVQGQSRPSRGDRP